MSILHTVNKSPFEHTTLNACLEVIGSQHALLLLEDGVYALLNEDFIQQLPQLTARGLTLYALTDDLMSRGLNDHLPATIMSIGYEKFVELSTQYQSVQSWY